MPGDRVVEADKKPAPEANDSKSSEAFMNDIFSSKIEGYKFDSFKSKSDNTNAKPDGSVDLVMTDPFEKGKDTQVKEPEGKDSNDRTKDGKKLETPDNIDLSIEQAVKDVLGDTRPKDAGLVLEQDKNKKLDQNDKPEAIEQNKPVKLDKMKFDESQVQEALDLAKKHNLPIAVYSGATWCGPCRQASPQFNDLAHDMAGANETKAIVLKLDVDNARALAGKDTEAGRALNEFLGDADRIPNIAVYDPNNLSTPVADSTASGWGKSTMKNYLDNAFQKISPDKVGKPGDAPGGVKENTNQVRTDFSEDNIKEAAQKAKEAGLPLLTYVEPDSSPDANVAKAFKYLNEQKLAVAANISAPDSVALRNKGLETSHFNAVGSAMQHKDLGNGASEPFYSAFNSAQIDNSMKFKASESVSPKTTDEVIDFMKKSGVDLGAGNHEAAVRALLEGKPIPEAVEKAPEAAPEKFETKHSVKSVEEAKKVMDLAREKGLPLVVHADTVICDDTSCTKKGLEPHDMSGLEDKAVFMEIPRGGFDAEESKGNKDLEALNELFKVSTEDHKTEIDVHAFRFNAEKQNAMEELSTRFKQSTNMNMYLSGLIKDK